MFRSVCETSVPSTTGRRSRTRPTPPGHDQRARRLAEARRQRGRHQHADHRRRAPRRGGGRAPGQRGAQDRVPGLGAESIDAHISAKRDQHPDGRGGHQRVGRSTRCRCAGARATARPAPPRRRGDQHAPARARHARGGARRGAWLERRQPLRAHARAGLGRARRRARARARRAAGSALGHARARPRRHPITSRGDVRPREALGALARGLAHPAAALRVDRQRRAAPRRAPRGRRRDEHAVDAVAHHVAVARDVGGDDRRARRERLGQHHAEALAAERRRAEHVRLAAAGATSRRRRPARDLHALRRRAAAARPPRRLGRPPSVAPDARAAQRLERAQQHGQALALLGAADEQRAAARSSRARAAGLRRGQVDAVRDDPVAAAVEALGRSSAAASDTAIRTLSLLYSRRAPTRLAATLFANPLVE